MTNPRKAVWITATGSISGTNIYNHYQRAICRLARGGVDPARLLDAMRNHAEAHLLSAGRPKADVRNALNNCEGTWNERLTGTLIADAINDFNTRNPGKESVAVKLPSARDSAKVGIYAALLRIINSAEFKPGGKFHGLSGHLNHIYMPSPDLVVIRTAGVSHLLAGKTFDAGSTEMFYILESKVNPTDIVGTISLKTSTRPDRRYQAMFEAEMTKALADHAGLNWKTDFITSKQDRPKDAVIYMNAVSISSLLKRNLSLRFANHYLHVTSLAALQTHMDTFLL